MFDWISARVARARQRAGLHRFVIVLRMLLGFSFFPAGLKKVFGEPFTDPSNVGAFHDFLHAFHDTGAFYHFVGVMQLVAAVLLLTQRYATLGVALLAPILTAIFIFCWSTGVVFTASVVTLMMLGVLGLLLWDVDRFRGLLARPGAQLPPTAQTHPAVAMPLWERCGAAIAVLYLGHTAITGEVYRPRGAEWANPSFYVLVAIALAPVITWVIERRRARRSS